MAGKEGIDNKQGENLEEEGDNYAKEGDFVNAIFCYREGGVKDKEKIKEIWRKQGDKLKEEWENDGHGDFSNTWAGRCRLFNEVVNAYKNAGASKDEIKKLYRKAGNFASNKTYYNDAVGYYKKAELNPDELNDIEELGTIKEAYNLLRRPKQPRDKKELETIEKRLEEIKKQKGKSSLEERTHLLEIVGASFLGSLIFSSKVITGNVISGSSFRPGSFIGMLLFVLGIVGFVFYFKKK